ncbi:MAG: polysaccharide biosynthesis/export family protein, partial [Candidatus Binatia bacterium]
MPPPSSLRRFLAPLLASLAVGCGWLRPAMPPAATPASSEALVEFAASREKPYSEPDPRLGARDRIRIEAGDLPELTGEYDVSPGGLVRLPLVGTMRASGKRVGSFEEELERKLRSIVVRPAVEVSLVGSGRWTTSVLGAVGKPGSVALRPDGTTLLEAV